MSSPTNMHPHHKDESGPAHHDAHAHSPHLQHHWDSLGQQFEAGKLGMWLFLATEVLLFGGLFCAYAVWRGQHPELFKYGSLFLNTKLGAINTAVLIASSLTMAWGVTCAQKNQRMGLLVCLFLTLCGAGGFLGIKYVEYKHKFHEGLFPGIRFYQPSAHFDSGAHPASPAVNPAMSDQNTPGTTPTHGVDATHAPAQPATAAAAPATSPATQRATATAGHGAFELQTIAVTPSEPGAEIPAVEASTIMPAQIGPAGLASDANLEVQPMSLIQGREDAPRSARNDPNRPDNTHMFFNIYFMMTGLHGIHVLIGMIVIGWLLVRAWRGHFSSEYFTPVDLGGLYWHIVDLIWIFLFPLFYLI